MERFSYLQPLPPTSASSSDSGSTESDPPFLIVLRQRDRTPGGGFVPCATVEITPALRASGLLRDVPPDRLLTLLLLLTFVTANGVCEATALSMADAQGISEGDARKRLERLRDFRWRGLPLAVETVRESGLATFSPSAAVVTVRQAEPEKDAGAEPAPVFHPAGRAAIIEHSRAAFARPRAEVEREILEFLGHHPEENQTNQEEEGTPEGEARRKLLALGVSRPEADRLLDRYPLEDIANQISWMGYRQARNPARFLVAAIENGYDSPPRARLERAVAAEGKHPQGAGNTTEAIIEDSGIQSKVKR